MGAAAGKQDEPPSRSEDAGSVPGRIVQGSVSGRKIGAVAVPRKLKSSSTAEVDTDAGSVPGRKSSGLAEVNVVLGSVPRRKSSGLAKVNKYTDSVPGRKKPSTSVTKGSDEMLGSYITSSEEVFDLFCQPCDTVGQHVEAEGFCNDCVEYLCKTCYSSHRKPKPSRNHRLLDKNQMPKSQSPSISQSSIRPRQDLGNMSKSSQLVLAASQPSTPHRRDPVPAASQPSTQHRRDPVPAVSQPSTPHRRDPVPAASQPSTPHRRDPVPAASQHSTPHRRDPGALRARCQGSINVKADNDQKDCWINGFAILGTGHLVVADYDNKSVKLIDVTQAKMISVLGLSSKPWDIAEAGSGKVAITLLGGIIQLMSVVSSTLTPFRQIHVSGYCNGIVYNNGRLIVSFCNPGSLKVIDMQGVVLRRIYKDTNGARLFNDIIQHPAISPDGATIYISDSKNHTVISVTTDGQVKAKYTDDKLRHPRGLTVAPDGTVYVCGGTPNNIHQLTADLAKIQVILSKDDGMDQPLRICYSDQNSKLYVGSSSCSKHRNSIQVFHLQ